MRKLVLIVAGVLFLECFEAEAAIRMASPFTDSMVLQQGMPVPIWGTAASGEHVSVEFGKQKESTTADINGQWRVTLKKLEADRNQVPQVLKVTGTDPKGGVSTVTINDVLIGEVWICSGQSNMQFPVSAATNARVDTGEANYPQIRMFTVGYRTAAVPESRCEGRWMVCSPTKVGSFSAVGYFFARTLHKDLNIPVGMINSSWGGSPVEPWTSLDALRGTTSACQRVISFEKNRADYEADKGKLDQVRDEAIKKQADAMAEWTGSVFTNDIGFIEQWYTGVMGTNVWNDTPMPMEAGAPFLHDYCGFVWCRTEFDIPSAWLNRDINLNLGSVDEQDTTYVNGTVVGETLDVSKWQEPRHYRIPAAMATNQHMVLVIRVVNQSKGVGVFGSENDFNLVPSKPAADEKPVSLTAGWKYAFGSPINVSEHLSRRPNISIPSIPGSGWDVSTIYNAMIAPLAPYALRGAIWYQGESNADQPLQYAELFPAMISSWRKTWGQKDFDFLFVQLANYMARQQAPIETKSWADIRDSQRLTLADPHAGMAVAIDIGEATDIHPRNKQDVGKRLALWALARTYGKKGFEYSGPLYRSMKIKDNRAIVTFDHAGAGLESRGTPLVGFAVAGEDKIFHAAKAAIEGETVVVSSDSVAKPVAVRYAWANNPICNLYNKDGLPASSFRTDTWSSSEIKAASEPLSEPVSALLTSSPP